MVRYLSIFLSVLFLFCASCEDTQKSKNNSIKTTPKITDTIKKDSSNKEKATKQSKISKTITQEELIPFLTDYGNENQEHRIRIKTSFGDIDVLLFMDTPLHRANFIYLTKEGYFNGTFFHRVAQGFVIQGGNSDNPETSKKRNNNGSYLIPSEFAAGHKHKRGAFSAAKYSEQNVSKASSPYEFFIVQSDRGAHHLDNDHTVYGEVISGMDVVDTIAKQPIGEGEWPLINIPMKIEILDN